MRGLLRVAVCAVALSFVAVPGTAFAATSAPSQSGSVFKVVANNLNNPRKIFVGRGGVLYVTEAGVGGNGPCATDPASGSQSCIGLSGSVTRISKGTQKRVLTGLPSVAGSDGTGSTGPADVRVTKGTYQVLLQDTNIDSHGGNPFGPNGAVLGDLVTTAAGKAKPKVKANFAVFEAAHNPDNGAGPGPPTNPAIDSDPYAFTPYRRGFAVADAAGNDLLWVNSHGTISVLAVFPLASPPGAATAVQSVPTSVAVGPDGVLYVGELTGFPFTVGTARIWRVVPGHKPTLFASGFTNISALAFSGKNLLVLEIDSQGLLNSSAPGALYSVTPKGTRTLLASTGLVTPTGLAVSHGSIYISNYGTFPGSGPGPHGQVVRIPA